MPTQPFTGTAYGPTPLLLNALHGQVGGQPKKMPFLIFFFFLGGVHFQKYIC